MLYPILTSGLSPLEILTLPGVALYLAAISVCAMAANVAAIWVVLRWAAGQTARAAVREAELCHLLAQQLGELTRQSDLNQAILDAIRQTKLETAS